MYTLNSYNGCQIGCVYCNSRSEKYHLPLHFEELKTQKHLDLSENMKKKLNLIIGKNDLKPDNTTLDRWF